MRLLIAADGNPRHQIALSVAYGAGAPAREQSHRRVATDLLREVNSPLERLPSE
ncbi:hypothetical protein OKW29_001545 [Paraburkholderia sp. CI3]